MRIPTVNVYSSYGGLRSAYCVPFWTSLLYCNAKFRKVIECENLDEAALGSFPYAAGVLAAFVGRLRSSVQT